MRKKIEEYIPQFDYSNFDEKEYKKETNEAKCLYCGKPSVSLNNGVCFSCRSKIEQKSKATSFQEPNLNLYLDWYEQKSINRAKSLHLGLLVYPFYKYGYATIWFYISILCAVFLLLNIEQIESFADVLPFIFLIIFNLIIGFITVKIRNKRKLIKFKKYNEMDVELLYNTTSWVCPCCHYINEKISFCRNCGVFPSSLKQKN